MQHRDKICTAGTEGKSTSLGGKGREDGRNSITLLRKFFCLEHRCAVSLFFCLFPEVSMDIPRMKVISTPFALPCRSRKSSVARRKWETFAIVKAPQSKRGKVCWGGGGRGRTAAEHDRRRPTANRNFQLPSLSARAEEPQSRDPTLPSVGFWRRGGGGGGGGRKSQPPGKGGGDTAATRARRTAEEAGANSKRRGGRSEGGVRN